MQISCCEVTLRGSGSAIGFWHALFGCACFRCKYPANVCEPLHEHFNEGCPTIALNDVEIKVETQEAQDRSVDLK